jgi:hypothetical protein
LQIAISNGKPTVGLCATAVDGKYQRGIGMFERRHWNPGIAGLKDRIIPLVAETG